MNHLPSPQTTRRQFLTSTLCTAAGASIVSSYPASVSAAEKNKKPKPAHKKIPHNAVGITTGSFMKHLTIEPQKGKMRLLDLPGIMSNELDIHVIDLMTRTLASFDDKYLDQLRSRAEKVGVTITNMKMNQRDLDMASPDAATRKHALDTYKKTIDSSQRLGCRWVRPAPGSKRPDITRLADAYRELIDYSAPKGISLLLENNGWIRDDPSAIPKVIKAVGKGLDAAPDTGNWSDEARYEGLAKAFPLAVTCDYKAYMFGPNGEHPRYDLKRCFQIAWDAGFRGPWCFEHFDETLPGLLKGFARLRDLIGQWSNDNSKKDG